MYKLGFDLQAGALGPMVEDVRGRREVCGPDDLLLLFGELIDLPDGRQCGKPDTPQQVLEPYIVPQGVHARIHMKRYKPVGVLLVGFLQVFNRTVAFSQADVDSGEEVGCDILLLG